MISVVIPVYNSEKFIKQAVNSVLKQSYTDIEIIIVNDGSVDNTAKICMELSRRNKKIRYFEKSNTGVSDTRNYGIKNSQGKYLFFLDSDDYLPENALEILMKEMNTGKYDVVYGNLAYCYDKRIIPRIPRIKEGEYTYNDVKNKLLDDGTLSGILFGSACGAIYKKEIIDKYDIFFDKEIKVNEDGFFNLKYIRHSSKLKVINNKGTFPYVYVYRQWENKLNETLCYNKSFDVATLEIYDYLKKQEDYIEYRQQFFCREVSVAFWNAIRVKNSKTNIIAASKYLNTLFSRVKTRKGLKYLNCNNMNKYKRIICFMIKHKMVISFYFVVRYIYPIAERILRR